MIPDVMSIVCWSKVVVRLSTYIAYGWMDGWIPLKWGYMIEFKLDDALDDLDDNEDDEM